MLGPAGDVEMEHWNTAHTRDSGASGIWYLVEVEAESPVDGVGWVRAVEVQPQLEGEGGADDGLRLQVQVHVKRDAPRNKNILSNRAWYCNKKYTVRSIVCEASCHPVTQVIWVTRVIWVIWVPWVILSSRRTITQYMTCRVCGGLTRDVAVGWRAAGGPGGAQLEGGEGGGGGVAEER